MDISIFMLIAFLAAWFLFADMYAACDSADVLHVLLAFCEEFLSLLNFN